MNDEDLDEVELMATARMERKPADYDSLVLQAIESLRKHKRAHAWFAKQGPSRFRARGQYPACAWCGVDVHKEHCEWVKAKELKL